MNRSMAVIGCGYWGQNLVRNLWELGVLSTICDSEPARLTEFKNRYPGLRTTPAYEDVLNDPDIQAVAIATPAATHHHVAREAFRRGKDVFVEKPLALTVKQGQELVRLAQRKKKILMVGHILHYHPAVIKLRALIGSGALGSIRYIYSNRLNLGKLRTEENILWSFAPHDISVILMLLGQDPIHVSSFGGDYLNKGIYDTTVTTMSFRNGVKAHIFVSWLHPYKEQKLIVVGSRAMAVFDDMIGEKLRLYPHQIEWKSGNIPVAHKADYRVMPVDEGEPLKRELQHFIECVDGRKSPRTDGKEGLRVLKVLAASEQSLKKGRKYR